MSSPLTYRNILALRQFNSTPVTALYCETLANENRSTNNHRSTLATPTV
jgi:hypothetical protein